MDEMSDSNIHCRTFCFCDFDLDPTTFIYELDRIRGDMLLLSFTSMLFSEVTILWPVNACISLRVITSGHVTKMMVTEFDPS